MLRTYAIRGAIAFFTVFLSILTGANLFEGAEAFDGAASLSVLETAALGGLGAVLRVAQTGLEELGQKYG